MLAEYTYIFIDGVAVAGYFFIGLGMGVLVGGMEAKVDAPMPEFALPGFHTDGIWGVFGHFEACAAWWDVLFSLPLKFTFSLTHYLLEPAFILFLLIALIRIGRVKDEERLRAKSLLAKRLLMGYLIFLCFAFLIPSLAIMF